MSMTWQHTIRTSKIKQHKSTYAVYILIFYFMPQWLCFVVSTEELITVLLLLNHCHQKELQKHSTVFKRCGEEVRRSSELGNFC